MSRRPTLVLLYAPDPSVHPGALRLPIPREAALIVGRNPDADLTLPDARASRKHAEIRWDGERVTVKDLSQNGTSVDGARFEVVDGDVVRFGDSFVILRFAPETDEPRRVRLRGEENVRKRYLIQAAGFNLGLVMRQILGAGTPREVANRHSALFVTLRILSAWAFSALKSLRVNLPTRCWSGPSEIRVSALRFGTDTSTRCLREMGKEHICLEQLGALRGPLGATWRATTSPPPTLPASTPSPRRRLGEPARPRRPARDDSTSTTRAGTAAKSGAGGGMLASRIVSRAEANSMATSKLRDRPILIPNHAKGNPIELPSKSSLLGANRSALRLELERGLLIDAPVGSPMRRPGYNGHVEPESQLYSPTPRRESIPHRMAGAKLVVPALMLKAKVVQPTKPLVVVWVEV